MSTSPHTTVSDVRRLTLIRSVHTAAWFSIEACVAYLLWSGATGHSDRRAAWAASVVGGEVGSPGTELEFAL